MLPVGAVARFSPLRLLPAFVACVFLVWWFITNYTGLSG